MSKETLMFGNIKIDKTKFFRHKTPILLKDVDIEKVLVSKQISFVEKNYKYFTGYWYDNHKVKSLHIMLPRTSTFVIKLVIALM